MKKTWIALATSMAFLAVVSCSTSDVSPTATTTETTPVAFEHATIGLAENCLVY